MTSNEDAVNAVKASEERQVEYMTMMVHDMEVREEGRAEGWAEGHAAGRAEGEALGLDRGIVQSIRNLMESLQMTEQQAMDGLKIPETDRSKYSAMLKS